MNLFRFLLPLLAITISLSGMQDPDIQAKNLRKDKQSYLSRIPRELYVELYKFYTRLTREEFFCLCNHQSETKKQILGQYSSNFCRMMMHPNNNQIILSNGSEIKIINPEDGKCIQTLNGHTDAISCFIINTQNNQIISGSDDRTIKIWNCQGECLQTLVGHTDRVNCLAIDYQSNTFISGSRDGTIKVWKLTTGHCLNTFNTTDSVYSLAFDAKRNHIIASYRNCLTVLNYKTGECIKRIENEREITNLVIDPINDHLLSLSIALGNNGVVKMWDLEQMKCIKVLGYFAQTLIFNPVYNVIICCYYTKVFILDMAGNLLYTRNWFLKESLTATFDSNNNKIISAEVVSSPPSLNIVSRNLIDAQMKITLAGLPLERRAAFRTLSEHVYQCFINEKPLDFNDCPNLYEIFMTLPPALQDTIRNLIKIVPRLEFLHSMHRMW